MRRVLDPVLCANYVLMTTTRRIALFDFDGTLVRHDSLLSFARFALPRCRFWFGLLLSLPAILLWKIGAVSADKAKQRLFGAWFAGMPYGRLEDAGRRFAKVIDGDLNPIAMKLLHERKAEGCLTVIVTAGMPLWIAPWADANGFDCVIATEPEVDSRGALTGRFATHNCRGEEKVRRVRLVFPDFDECITYAYADSRADSAMLQMATYSDKL